MNEIIRKLRKRKGITQQELAKYLNIKQSTISRIENGNINVSFNKILKIFLYLNASKNDINNYLTVINSSKCYDFFTMIAQDFNLINQINKNPSFCINQFKKSLYS